MKLLNVEISVSNYGISIFGIKNGLPNNTLSSLNIHSGFKSIERGVLINITDSLLQKFGLVKLFNFFKLFKLTNSFVKLLPENDQNDTGYVIDFQPLCKHDSSVIVELVSKSDEACVTKQTTYKTKKYDSRYSCTLVVIHCCEETEQTFDVIAVKINKTESKVDIAKGKLSIGPNDKLNGNIVSKLDFDKYSILHETTVPMFNYLMNICNNSLVEISNILIDKELKAMHYQNFNTVQYLKNFKHKASYTKQQII
jgi:hypothetical protein